MTSATSMATRLSEMQQLLRLRRMHEDAARSHYMARCSDLDAAREMAANTQRRVAQLRQQVTALSRWFGGDADHMLGTYEPYATAHLDLLDEELESAEYALIDEKKAVVNAERRRLEAMAAWNRARARTQAVEQLLARTKRQSIKHTELRLEHNTETPTRPLPWASSPQMGERP